MAGAMAMWTTPFMPNLLNTCVFLVETSQCIAVLLVNYKGRPWMKGLTENHALFLSVFACAAGCAESTHHPLLTNYYLSISWQPAGASPAAPRARGACSPSSTS